MMDARPSCSAAGMLGSRSKGVLYTVNEEETTMGGILEMVEMLKSPVGIIVLLLAIGGIVLFVRWVKQD
jgi:hypothetical protein